MKIKEYFPPMKIGKKRIRCLLLFSGGLDSTLAGKILEEQGIDILPVNFKSSFFSSAKAIETAQQLNWPLIIIDITEEELKLVENPKHGYGKNMNPCIDCHAQMIKFTGQLMQKYNAKFIATGEIVNERPMSQNPKSLKIVEKESGFEGYILRPLSAKLLPMTIPEKEGLVKREMLLGLSGRSRKPQMVLAEKYGLKKYSTPAGGCLLTDPGFSLRLKKLLTWKGKLELEDVELIKRGRSIFTGENLIVIGRNKLENKILMENVKENDVIITTVGKFGPVTIIRSLNKIPNNDIIEKASLLTIRYSRGRKLPSQTVKIKIKNKYEFKTYKFSDWEKYF
ncbi:tRNA 4-thiouridine(8) synthase ThiI [Candidatus Aminicenantes bacterium AH-873-B07]|nr:tRNA 4-thiouridine(8) synthase ThiI [Candidatus Aminicenantes bacterium AH-873-B07]